MIENTLNDHILSQCVKHNIPVTVFLMNGFQIKGTVSAHDNDVVVVVSEGRQNMIYNHAISTIVPGKPVNLD